MADIETSAFVEPNAMQVVASRFLATVESMDMAQAIGTRQ